MLYNALQCFTTLTIRGGAGAHAERRTRAIAQRSALTYSRATPNVSRCNARIAAAVAISAARQVRRWYQPNPRIAELWKSASARVSPPASSFGARAGLAAFDPEPKERCGCGCNAAGSGWPMPQALSVATEAVARDFRRFGASCARAARARCNIQNTSRNLARRITSDAQQRQ